MVIECMLRKFKVSYGTKLRDSRPGHIHEYSTARSYTMVRAKTSGDARAKMRKNHGYNIVNIKVEEVTKTWIKKILKWLKR